MKFEFWTKLDFELDVVDGDVGSYGVAPIDSNYLNPEDDAKWPFGINYANKMIVKTESKGKEAATVIRNSGMSKDEWAWQTYGKNIPGWTKGMTLLKALRAGVITRVQKREYIEAWRNKK